MDDLEQQLQLHKEYRLRIGAFSAASNITGIKSDSVGITCMLKKHGALSIWYSKKEC